MSGTVELYVLAARVSSALEAEEVEAFQDLLSDIAAIPAGTFARGSYPALGTIAPAEDIGSFLEIVLEAPSFCAGLTPDQLDALEAHLEDLSAPQAAATTPEAAPGLVEQLAELMKRLWTAPRMATMGAAAAGGGFADRLLDAEGNPARVPDRECIAWVAAAFSGDRLTVYLESDIAAALIGPFQPYLDGQPVGAPVPAIPMGAQEARLDVSFGALQLTEADGPKLELRSPNLTVHLIDLVTANSP